MNRELPSARQLLQVAENGLGRKCFCELVVPNGALPTRDKSRGCLKPLYICSSRGVEVRKADMRIQGKGQEWND